jgi:Zn-dependent M28 family amino/carboxypeptidase
MPRLSALLLLVPLCASAQVLSIQGERIRPHVKFLSSDLLEGRAPGHRGGALAAEYIAAQFAAAGLKPGGDQGTYLQRVPLKLVEVLPGASLNASAGGKTVSFKWLDGFVATSQRQQPAARIDAEAVFAGHGIRAPEFNWDDYAGVDVRGKVVVLFTNEPPSEDPKFFAGRALTYYGRWTYKYEEAARQGAVAALIIHTTPTASYGWEVLRANGRPQPQVAYTPGAPALTLAGWITTEAGRQLLSLAGRDADSLLQAAGQPGFKAFPLGIRVRGALALKTGDIGTHNVVGHVPGAHPAMKDEAVVFSAHWDHLGIGQPVHGDSIYNGALDNATGVAMLIEMARAWASLEAKPHRSAYFAAVTAEESGLLGAHYFVAHPPLPAGRMAANLNFDSLSFYGRPRDAVLTGYERTTLAPVVESIAKRFQFTLKPDPNPAAGSYYRSDHFAFARAGVPAFSVNMGREFEGKSAAELAALNKKYGGRYHQPSDEYDDSWDFSGMEHMARFGFTLGLEIANLEKLPGWKPGDEFSAAREASQKR